MTHPQDDVADAINMAKMTSGQIVNGICMVIKSDLDTLITAAREYHRLRTSYEWADTQVMPPSAELIDRNRILRHENDQLYIETGRLEDETTRLKADVEGLSSAIETILERATDFEGCNIALDELQEALNALGEKK